MSAAGLIAFWGVSLVFVLTPGADWAYAIAAGLRHRSVLPSVLGLLLGHLIATLVVAAGVAALVARTPLVLTVLTVLGAGYLLWLGIGMLRSALTPAAAPAAASMAGPAEVNATANVSAAGGSAPDAAIAARHTTRTPDGHEPADAGPAPAALTDPREDRVWRRVAKGAGVSGLNPKVFLLFLALLPQFTDPGRSWPLAVQIICLGLVHIGSCAVVYLAVGLAARRVLRARPGAARMVTRLSGVAMIVIALVLLVEQLHL